MAPFMIMGDPDDVGVLTRAHARVRARVDANFGNFRAVE